MWKWRVDRRKGSFYNPVSQSRRHAKYLGELLDQTVVPMVVFAGSARVDSNASCVFDSPRRLMPAILAACSGDVDESELASLSQGVAQAVRGCQAARDRKGKTAAHSIRPAGCNRKETPRSRVASPQIETLRKSFRFPALLVRLKCPILENAAATPVFGARRYPLHLFGLPLGCVRDRHRDARHRAS